MDNFLRDFQTADWTKHEFARCWWFPYTKKAILWNGDKTDLPLKPRPKSWYAGGFSRWSYEFLLWVGTFWPKLVPSVERWVFKMQYGSTEGKVVEDAVEKSYEALSMDCLFSQLVNEVSPLQFELLLFGLGESLSGGSGLRIRARAEAKVLGP